MKKIISLLLIFSSLLSLVILLPSCAKESEENKEEVYDSSVTTLNVYNWGEYISDGSDDTMDVNKCFEEYYYETYGKKVRVNYTTFASNEDMYNKLKSGAVTYDVIIPSDYMIQKMIAEDMLLEINFDNVPNFQYIDEEFQNCYYDPENLYSVPYAYGMVGIIYNNTMVDEEDIGSWDLMWNEKYRGKILQFNNPRDAFGTAMYRAGIDVNTTDNDDWVTALEALKEQKPLVQSYVMDEVFNKMKTGSAAIAAYYAGDYLTMYEDNDALSFYYPEEGTNVYIDAMCIPSCCKEKELAEAYINYLLSEEPAVAIAEYIMYASPNTLVTSNEEYLEYMLDCHEDAMEIIYREGIDVFSSYYYSLSPKTNEIQNSLWEELKIESSIEIWIHVTSGIIVFGLLALIVGIAIRNKRRAKYYNK